jgi:hypothetical protein
MQATVGRRGIARFWLNRAREIPRYANRHRADTHRRHDDVSRVGEVIA